MNTLKERKLDFFSPKSGGTVNIESIPNTIVLLAGQNAIDIGSRCFTDREHLTRTRNSRFQKVCMESLCDVRASLLHKAVTRITEEIKNAESSEKTIFSKIQIIIKYIDWCDKKALPCPLKAEGSEESFKLYSQYLENQISVGSLSINTAATYQATVEKALMEYMDLPSASRKTKRIRKNFHASSPTLPPAEKDFAKYLAVSESLFDQISVFLLDFHEFPLRLHIPEAIETHKNHVWLFPTNSILYDIENPENYLPRCIDHINGTIKNLNSIKGEYCSTYEARIAAKRANKKILDANSTKNNRYRMKLGAIARHAFIAIFLANIGCTWEELVSTECAENFEDSFHLNSEFQGFRVIKNRAWAENTYTVEPKFLKKLKKYFEMRKLLLGQKSSNLLFAVQGINDKSTLKQPGDQLLIQYHKQLLHLDGSIKLIRSRQFRKFKANFIGNNQDYSLASIAAQNKQSTFRRHYIVGAEADCIDGMGDFLNELHKASTRTSVASCNSVDSPSPAIISTTIEPNCDVAASCLFCENFLFHADIEDIRKLLSFRFFTQQIDFLSGSFDFYNKLHGPVLKRIDEIIDEVSKISEQLNNMVKEIDRSIKINGSIDSYWQGKLNQILDIYGD